MFLQSNCAGCGTTIEIIPGCSDVSQEFCGDCNHKYYESLDYISPEELAKGEALEYAALLHHAQGGGGEADELCCSSCYKYSIWLNSQKNLYGNLPSKIDHPEPLFVRVGRQLIQDIRQGLQSGNTQELERSILCWEVQCNH